MTDARGVSLAEVLVATCVLSVGLVAIVTGLQYATASVDRGRAETAAVLLAEARLEHLRSVGLADWDDPQLAPGTTREDYRTIAGAEGFRRETTVADRGGPGYAALVAATDAEDSWSALLEGATARHPWVVLPGLPAAALPGLQHPAGTYTVVIRNDAEAADAALTGQPPDADAARDANGVVVLRSTGSSSAAVRTVEVVVQRRRLPGRPSAGVRALHAMSNWRER